MQYPADWLRARQLIEADRSGGAVLLLPWAQYRRYPWNHGEAVFDPWPLIGRPMHLERARCASAGRRCPPRVSEPANWAPVIGSGRPRTAELIAAGVRFVIVDSGSLLSSGLQHRAQLAAKARLPGASVVLASRDLVVFRLPASP